MFRHAEMFCEIVTHHSFSKAAEARGVSQPAVSQALQQLEEHLGVTLIDRSKRPLELTAAGQVYFEGCKRLFDDYRLLEDRILNLGDKVTGRVRVASIYSVGLLQMADYVTRYETAHPDVGLQLDYLHPDDVYERVRNDEADLGLVSFPRDGGDIACIPWLNQRMGLVVSPNHRFAGRQTLLLSDLDGEDFVAFTQDLRIRKEVDRMLKKSRVSINLVHQFDNIENIKRAVEIGVGVSILPLPTARREIEAGWLRGMPFDDVDWVRPLGIVKKRHRHLSTAVKKFVELLQQANADDAPWTTPANGAIRPT